MSEKFSYKAELESGWLESETDVFCPYDDCDGHFDPWKFLGDNHDMDGHLGKYNCEKCGRAFFVEVVDQPPESDYEPDFGEEDNEFAGFRTFFYSKTS